MVARIRWAVACCALVSLCAVSTGAAAQTPGAVKGATFSKRVALVVGNARYSGVPALVNTVNDSEDMCNALRELKFEVICVRDVKSRRDFKRNIQDFRSRLGPGIAGLFYYAGHGLQIDGENYLLPTEAQIDRKEDVEEEAVSMRFVMASLDEAQNEFNLIILDACRNSPFTRGFTRAASRGLAPVSDTPTGSLVLYSTAANDTASDGVSGQRNSPFAKHLLANIRAPGLTVEGLIKKVSASVQADTAKLTGKRQVPFSYGSFTGDFCFAGCETPEDAAANERKRLEAERARAEAERVRTEAAALDRRRAELEAREAEMKRQAAAEAARVAAEAAKPAPRSAPEAPAKPPPRTVLPPSF